jgi:hypothetical protein
VLPDFDELDWPNVLAWFAARAQKSDHAELSFLVDGGSRHRYVWDDGSLMRLMTASDQKLDGHRDGR